MIIKFKNNKFVKIKTKTSSFPMIKMRKDGETPSISKYLVSVVSDDDSMGTTSGSGLYYENTNVKIKAIPNIGYEFSHWSDGDTNVERTIIVNSDITLTAYFKQKIDVGVLSYVPNDLYINPYEDPKQDLTI